MAEDTFWSATIRLFDSRALPRPEAFDQIAQHGDARARAKLAAGLAQRFVNEVPDTKGEARQHLGSLLRSDPNGLIREMDPSDLTRLVKSFLYPPADLKQLKEALSGLSPQSSAKLIKALHSATGMVAAEVKAGNWLTDLLGGFGIEGSLGRSSGTKGGEAASGGEATAGVSKGISVSWSPGKMIEGKQNRQILQISREVDYFMQDWTPRLNDMSPNEKAIFVQEMGRGDLKVAPKLVA